MRLAAVCCPRHSWGQFVAALCLGWLGCAGDSATHDPALEPTLIEAGIAASQTAPEGGNGYDVFEVERASELLLPELIESSHHRVNELVVPYGALRHYVVHPHESERIEAYGDEHLRSRIAEVHAVSALEELSRTKGYALALSESLLSPLAAAKSLLLHPASTLSGIPAGAWVATRAAIEETRGERTDREDAFAAALLTVSKYKRRLASDLAVDVYSDNAALQRELNRIGWAAALGNWTPTLALLPLTGAGKTAYTALGWTDILNRAVLEEAPDVLRYRSRDRLASFGVTGDDVDAFLHQPVLSPRNLYAIALALESIEGAEGREHVIVMANRAKTSVDAFHAERMVELLARYHRFERPIASFIPHRGVVLALAQGAPLVLLLPIDVVRWTPFTADLVSGLEHARELSDAAAGIEVWITGEFSARARKELGARGVGVIAHAAERLDRPARFRSGTSDEQNPSH